MIEVDYKRIVKIMLRRKRMTKKRQKLTELKRQKKGFTKIDDNQMKKNVLRISKRAT